MKPTIEMRTPKIAEMIEVIHTVDTRGNGTNENPVRLVHQYWDKKGNLLAENDEY